MTPQWLVDTFSHCSLFVSLVHICVQDAPIQGLMVLVSSTEGGGADVPVSHTEQGIASVPVNSEGGRCGYFVCQSYWMRHGLCACQLY